ncbi:MFS transporter [Granulosicoccus sp. 3-233]|uniref:MFS transporter n=1 Tax=Granulosicoccus sp. 3-233 TaxID=3417969 RepID=UPI003D3371EE
MNPLRHPVFRWLFAAQILSLLGIGIMTVGLALLAYELGGVAGAGKLLGGIFALKMVVYVLLAPLAEVVLSRFEARRVLIGLDVFRFVLLLLFGMSSDIWQFAMLAFFFYTASAAFTPLFQAMIPAILPDEKTYASALMLSRLAYTFESMVSPILAALALLFVVSSSLFPLAALCLAGSVVTLALSGLPRSASAGKKRPFVERLTRGLNIYFRTPRLRGLFILNLALSCALAWVLVNTVVYAGLQFDDSDFYTWLMASYGTGAALGALSVPGLLKRFSERSLMVSGCVAFGLMSLLIFLPLTLPMVMLLWGGFGVASSLVLTPGGLVLTRSAEKEDHPAVFAAQFSMSHAGWLLAYPLAGWLGAILAPATALGVLGGVCLLITILASRVWPMEDPLERVHTHPDLPRDHPHLKAHEAQGEQRQHTHVFHIDDLHLRWNP